MPDQARLADPVASAKVWHRRLGIGDWPTIYRVHNGPLQIVPGDIDVVLLPSSPASEVQVLEAVMAYAFREVPEHQKPSAIELAKAANDLVNAVTAKGWPDGQASTEDQASSASKAA